MFGISAALAHAETRSHWLTQRRGGRGGREGAEEWFWLSGAAEPSRRVQGPCEVVVCSGRRRARGVTPASPGRIRGGMIEAPTGRNHIHHEHGSGRGTLDSTKNAA